MQALPKDDDVVIVGAGLGAVVYRFWQAGVPGEALEGMPPGLSALFVGHERSDAPMR